MPKFFGFFSQTGPVGSLAAALTSPLDGGAAGTFFLLAAALGAIV